MTHQIAVVSHNIAWADDGFGCVHRALLVAAGARGHSAGSTELQWPAVL